MGKMNKTGVTLTDLVQESLKNLSEDDLLKAEAENEYCAEIDQEANRQRIFDSFDFEMVSDVEVFKDAFEHTNLDEYLEYLDTKSKKQQQLDSYVSFSRLELQKLIDELNEKRERHLQDLTSTKFGTELLANFTLEVFLRLFDPRPRLQVYNLDGKHLNDYGTDFSSARKSIIEIFLNFIVYDTKIAELKLKNSGVQIKVEEARELDEPIPKAKNKNKRGRKAANTNEMFSLKDISNQDQISALNDLLIKNGYIEEASGRLVYTNATTKTIKKFATIIKNLCNYGYSDSLTAKQAYLILKNDYSVITKPDTVAQAADKTALGILKNNPYKEKK